MVLLAQAAIGRTEFTLSRAEAVELLKDARHCDPDPWGRRDVAPRGRAAVIWGGRYANELIVALDALLVARLPGDAERWAGASIVFRLDPEAGS